jgi:hypothetical protein
MRIIWDEEQHTIQTSFLFLYFGNSSVQPNLTTKHCTTTVVYIDLTNFSNQKQNNIGRENMVNLPTCALHADGVDGHWTYISKAVFALQCFQSNFFLTVSTFNNFYYFRPLSS